MLSAARLTPDPHAVVVLVEASDAPRSLEPLLASLDAVVVRAADVQELTLVSRELHPDLVIVNPGEAPGSLEDACAGIRRDPLTGALLVLLVTARDDHRAAAVADATVTLPTSAAEVCSVARLMLRAARGEEAARAAAFRPPR